MVIHLLALSQIPEHVCGRTVRQLLVPEKQRSGGSTVFEVLICFSGFPPQMDGVPKTAKTQKRRERVTVLLNVHK